MGILMDAGRTYPVSLLYLEPLIIVGQIAVTFESSTKYLGITMGGSSAEGKLMFWLVPLVPAAIVLPIEIGFIRDALAAWSGDEGESLRLVYAVRMFLAITLVVILAAIPAASRLGRRPLLPAIRFHHRMLTAYLACGAIGYLLKSYVSNSVDTLITVLFFVVGPLICFTAWSTRMWNASPADLEPAVEADPYASDDLRPFERHGAAQNP